MSLTTRFISNLHKISFNLRQYQRKNDLIQRRLIHMTSSLYLREVSTNDFTCIHFASPVALIQVIETTEGNVTTVEGRLLESPRKDQILKIDGDKKLCPLCRLNLDINYTDVRIISQFVQEDGEIVPRQISGVCYGQHVRMKKLIHQAHSAGLMQHLRPHIFPEEYSQMSDHAWKKYNVYYNEIIDD